MDITKLSGNTTGWNDSGLFGTSSAKDDSAVDTFLVDTDENTLHGSVSDLLAATRKRHQRQYTEPEMAKSGSMSALGTNTGGTTMSMSKTAGSKKKATASRGVKQDPTEFSVIERPANRVDIANLERELEVRVKAIVDVESVDIEDPAELADPRKDGMIIIRDKLLTEFGADIARLQREPWLDMLIKCECVKITCDDVGKKLIDMLSVSSVELGNVLRKLRLAYMQSFDQMRMSWQVLRATFVEYENDLFTNREVLRDLRVELANKEELLRAEMSVEMTKMSTDFEREKYENKDALEEAEFKMEQMGQTLVSLNGIFKNMQNDGTTVRMADLNTKCGQLEKENVELENKVLSLDKTKNDLEVALEKIALLEKEARGKDMEIANLQQQMVRREETVVALMERESIRNAEIEKMKDITGIQGEEDDLGIDIKEPTTSVLCIKCKKGLDDLNNIRAAILNKSDKSKVQCENYRILLPNLRGRRPDRSTEWLRSCMRNILMSKMREDVTMLDIKGDTSKFSPYVYAWFSRNVDWTVPNASELRTQQACDEDRWGLYYGVKAMARDKDPEATIFWSMLEENGGEDGMQFVFHCLSMALSMGGPDLWDQLGEALTSKSTGVNQLAAGDKPTIRNHVWMEVGCAVEACKAILVRALKPHVQEVVDAIEAFKVLPAVADPQVKEQEEAEKKKTEEAEAAEAAEAAAEGVEENKDGDGEGDGEGEGEFPDKPKKTSEEIVKVVDSTGPGTGEGDDGEVATESANPTHINLFVWLRLMTQQIQAEQIHRAAAVRLMCESASVGALTPQLASDGTDKDDIGTVGAQVEFPQFAMICKTLFPGISSLQCATLYHLCYDEGRRKVTADVLLKIADRAGLFSKAMRLTILPLLCHDIKRGVVEEEKKSGSGGPERGPESGKGDNNLQEGEEREEGDDEGGKGSGSGSGKGGDGFLKPITKIITPDPTLTKESKLRAKLATLIHRKMAAIIPDFDLLVQRVSDRYKAILTDARAAVMDALTYAFEKQKTLKLTMNELRSSSGHFVDGIQPYVQYRRLLATMLLVKSYSDNPLLPSELFLGKDRMVLPHFDFSLKHAETLLSALEEGVVTGLRLDRTDPTGKESLTKNLVNTVRLSTRLARLTYGPKGVSKVYRYVNHVNRANHVNHVNSLL